MRPFLALLFSFVSVYGLHAQIVNITADGTPIEGINSIGNYGTTGTEVNQQSQYPPTNMTDGDPNTSDQTFGSSAYAGLVGLGTATTTDAVTALTAQFHIFYDGGWFGVNGLDALDLSVKANQADGGTTPVDQSLTLAELVAPTLQITTDGTNWTTVAYTPGSVTSYDNALVGLQHYNAVVSGVATFTLVTPVSDIEGIRLIGTTGGTSDFLGVSEIGVLAETPEPSTYALLGAGILALVAWGRWRRLA